MEPSDGLNLDGYLSPSGSTDHRSPVVFVWAFGPMDGGISDCRHEGNPFVISNPQLAILFGQFRQLHGHDLPLIALACPDLDKLDHITLIAVHGEPSSNQ